MQCGRGRTAAALAGALLFLVLPLLATPGHACAGDDSSSFSSSSDAGVSRWDREFQLKGRRRSLLSMQGRLCGALHPAPELMQKIEFRLAAFRAKEAARVASGAMQGEGKVYPIPTYVYNVVSADGSDRGFVSDAGLKAQVDALNQAYATAVTPDGNVGSSGEQSGLTWKFDLQSIQRIKAGDMCDQGEEKKIKAANRKGSKAALNLYITDLSSCGLLGYSSWPWELDPKSGKADPVTMDGVVIHFETLPGGSYKPYNMGRTCIHETGHWMGLFHVFQNGELLLVVLVPIGWPYHSSVDSIQPPLTPPSLHQTNPTNQTLPPQPQAAARAATRWTTRRTRAPPPRAAPSRATRAPSRERTPFGTSWTTPTTSA